MRRLVLLILGTLAVAVGCSGSHPEVRLTSPAGTGTVQDKLDGVAAGWFDGLFGPGWRR